MAGTATGDESTAQAPAALRGAAAGAGVFAALCATLLGLGLGRFAFTPLLPALIAARWFGPGQAASLGAANLIGYLGGAAAAAWLAARCGLRTTLRGAMLAIVASLFACAAPIPFHWFFAWRLLSGFAGAVLMVLGPTAGLARVPPARRGLASGIVFLGIGFGIAGSGLGVPVLLGAGLGWTWRVLGLTALALMLASWPCWPTAAPPTAVVEAAQAETRPGPRHHLRALYVCYGLNAIGLVPVVLFLADFVARGLGRGIAAGAHDWALLGAGAVVGPLAAGFAADRLGVAAAFQALVLGQVAASLALAAQVAIGPAAVVLGASIPGTVTLVMGTAYRLAGTNPEARRRAWGGATAAYALGQAVGGYGFSTLYARSGSYTPLFLVGAVAFLASALLHAARLRGSMPLRG